ncbi:MAG: signal peptidase I, partial [Akkermansiaceae bacterium]
ASFFLFSRTEIIFEDGSTVVIGSPLNEAAQIETVARALNRKKERKTPHFKKGDPIFQGYLTSGDLVLVDKVSYHFRQPKRGESFVFDTRDIPTNGPQNLSSQQAGTHYIKRLAAVPGDDVQIRYPELYINGDLAKEDTLRRVMSQEPDSKGYPYTGYTNPRGSSQRSEFEDPNFTFHLNDDPKKGNNYREFFALGDNSRSSLDSRYWGTVKQYNLVGPAFISLWPFNSGHWGIIK